MTSQEMYIRVINDLQAIGAQRSRKYYPEQIELELNTEIENLVNGSMIESKKGFYTVDAKFADAIQPITERVALPVYTSEGEFFVLLPANCSHILEAAVNLSNQCRGLKTTDYTQVVVDTVTYNQLKTGNGKRIPTRRVRTGVTEGVKSSAYYKASKIEMPVVLIGNRIQILTGENFIVNRLFLTYVRNPRKINLSLGTSSDLAPAIHGLICDKAVTRVRERIGDPKYQTGIIQENKL